MSLEEAPDRPIDPEKLLRLASLTREVLEEARKLEPAEQTAHELASLHGRVKTQLAEALPNELLKELDEINLDQPFKDGATTDEVRIAYSGLIGWLGGLFQGLQASAQVEMALRMQKQAGRPPEIPEDPEEKQREGYL